MYIHLYIYTSTHPEGLLGVGARCTRSALWVLLLCFAFILFSALLFYLLFPGFRLALLSFIFALVLFFHLTFALLLSMRLPFFLLKTRKLEVCVHARPLAAPHLPAPFPSTPALANTLAIPVFPATFDPLPSFYLSRHSAPVALVCALFPR